MDLERQKDRILEEIKNIPLENWKKENEYYVAFKGLNITTYYRPNGCPPGVTVEGQLIFGTDPLATYKIYDNVVRHFKTQQIQDEKQKILNIYNKITQ